MGLLSTMLGMFRASSLENPRFSLNDPAAGDLFAGGAPASSGVQVNRETALCYSPWWRGVSLLSADVAKLPLILYGRVGEGKEKRPQHPAYRLVRRKPNPQQTAFQFRRLLTGHAISSGNGYAWIARRGDGSPLELWPLDPERTWPVRENGRLWYVNQVENTQTRIPAEDVLHIKGLGWDGLTGYSVVEKAKESIGLGIATRKYSAVYFRSAGRPAVVLEHPGKMNPDAVTRLRTDWERMHSGLENAHRTAILDAGMKAHVLAFSAEDSQLIESRQWELGEVANFLGLPWHKVGHPARTAYASLEQENQSYLTESLDPWLVSWEEECHDKLLTEEEKDSDELVVEFVRGALMRADLTARSNYYRAALGGAPWMTRNEVRALENLNPVEGGNEILDPLNMGGQGKGAGTGFGPPDGDKPPATDQGEGEKESSPPSSFAGLREPLAAILRSNVQRMVRRVMLGSQRAAARDPKAFLGWVDSFAGEHQEVFTEALDSIGQACDALAGRPGRQALSTVLLARLREACLELAGSATAQQLASAVEGATPQLETQLANAMEREYLSCTNAS